MAADAMGLTLGYFFSRFAFFLVFGFCFLIRKQLVTEACKVTPDGIAVLALSLVFLSLLTTVGRPPWSRRTAPRFDARKTAPADTQFHIWLLFGLADPIHR